MDVDEIIENYYTDLFIVYLNVALTSFVVFLYSIYLLLPRPKKHHAKSD